LKKLALEGVFSPLALLWGVLVNLTLAEKGAFFVTCEMPQVKVEKAVAFVDMTTHQPGCRTVTEKQHAELAGNVVGHDSAGFARGASASIRHVGHR
jgi:hypothetical protein